VHRLPEVETWKQRGEALVAWRRSSDDTETDCGPNPILLFSRIDRIRSTHPDITYYTSRYPYEQRSLINMAHEQHYLLMPPQS